jgi:hypothetical protein
MFVRKRKCVPGQTAGREKNLATVAAVLLKAVMRGRAGIKSSFRRGQPFHQNPLYHVIGEEQRIGLI